MIRKVRGLRVCFWLFGLLIFLPATADAQGSGDQGPADLKCIDTKAYVSARTEFRNAEAGVPSMTTITERELDDSLLVAVRSKLPRLQVSATCSNRLVLNVNLVDLSVARTATFVGTAALSLHRQVVILETRQTTTATLFTVEGPFWGSPERAKDNVLKLVDSLTTSFSASYYRATGNQ